MTVYGDFDHTFKQHENLSTAGAAFMPVYMATNNSVRIASTYTTKTIGILQKVSNSTKTGASVMVRLGAISKGKAGGTGTTTSVPIVAGDLVAAGQAGLRKVTALVVGTGGVGVVNVIGRALDAAATGAVFPILINPFAIVPMTILAANSGTVTIP